MKLPLDLLPRQAKPVDVVGFGENSLDLVAVLPGPLAADSKVELETFQQLPGGVVATAMVACARLGCRARYVGSLGTDLYGDSIRAALGREGLDLSATRSVEARNRIAVVLVEGETGRRTVLESRDARLAWRADDIDPIVMTSGRVLLVDARDLAASTAAVRAARLAGVATVVDVDQPAAGMDQLLGQIDILVTAEAFPAAYTGCGGVGEGLARLAAEFRPTLTLATLGAGGSLALCGGREIRTAAFRVPVVDTTGAGDAFRGGLIAGMLGAAGHDGTDVDTLLEYANAVAALNCRALGAQTALPSPAEVHQLVTGAGRVRSK